jgi:hypothetical protein
MSRVHPQHRQGPLVVSRRRPTGRARMPALVRVLAAALVGVSVGSLLALPAAGAVQVKPTTQLHKAKGLRTLPTTSTAKPAAASAPSSPYARAAAQRAATGLPPPGHPHVIQRVPTAPAANPVR